MCGSTGSAHLESTVLVASDLVVAVAVAIKGCEHDTEGSSPLAEEDEEMVSQRLLREEEAPVVDCADASVRTREKKTWIVKTFSLIDTEM